MYQVLGKVTANDGLGRDVIWSAASTQATNTWEAGGPIARPWNAVSGRYITLTNTVFPTPSIASGTSGALSKFTGTSTLGNSIITESGTTDTVAGNLAFSGLTTPGLVLNNLTAVQIGNLVTPPVGSTVFNQTSLKLNMWDGAVWNELRTGNYLPLTGGTMSGATVYDPGTITGSQPNIIRQDWNNGAVAFNGLLIDITSTANASSTFLDCYDDTVRRFWVSNGGTVNASQFVAGGDATLLRDAANTFGQRNGLNAQTFNVYGTYTDASTWRRVRTTMTTGGAATIAAESLNLGSAGTGNTLTLSAQSFTFATTAGGSVTLSATGYFNTPSRVEVPGYDNFAFAGRSLISCPADGELLLRNNAAGNANFFLKLGISSSAAAGIKRVLNELQVRLNDDSAFAALSCGQFTLNDANVVLGATTGSKIGTATTQKLGFWNATPIVQPSSTGENSGFTTGVGTHVHDTSTFDGGLGSTAYRISDIVRHLKSLGLIAQ